MSISTAPIASSRAALRRGATAAVAALIAVETYGAVAHAAGVSLCAGFPGARSAPPVSAASLAFGVVLAAFWGTLLSLWLARRASSPARTFTVIAVAVALISLVTPLAAAHATLSTRLTLTVAHLLVAGIMTPIMRSGLRETRR